MATKAHHRSQRLHRLGRVHRKFKGQWLFVLIARTLATILTMIVAHLLELPTCGGK
jgi:hypothetical protein